MNRTYLHTFLVIWGLLGLLYVFLGSHTLMHTIQDSRVGWMDRAMLIWTKGGEVYAAVIFFGLLWSMHRGQESWKPIRNGFLAIVLLAVVLPQGLKSIFADYPRPWKVFPDVHDIPGLTKSFFKSFPSGHTAFATALTAGWARMARPTYQYPIGMVLLATGVGYSRIHLHMHWLHDVLAGGILGLGCAYLGLRLTGFRETH